MPTPVLRPHTREQMAALAARFVENANVLHPHSRALDDVL